MIEFIPYAYLIWLATSMGLFWKLPADRACAITLIGGWMLLPIASFPAEVAQDLFPHWIMGTAIPTPIFINKATATGFSCLLSILLFDRSSLAQWRLNLWDGVLLLWCLVPIASALANNVPIEQGGTQAAYLFLAWGAPYIAGRLYFSSAEGLKLLAKSIVIAGLLYLPICLLEFAIGPTLYAEFYGFHPYQTDGDIRYILYRPIVLTEHGNQLGIWMATAALVAFWMQRKKALKSIGILSPKVISGSLLATTFLVQSVGAIILLSAGILFLTQIIEKRRGQLLAAILITPILFVGVRLSGLVPLEYIAYQTSLGQQARQAFHAVGRGSLPFRIKREEVHLDHARERPLLGWSTPYWWKSSGEIRPWSLWSLFFGMYGMTGFLFFNAIIIGPPTLFFFRLLKTKKIKASAPAVALAAVLLVNAIDSLLNSTYILALISANGGLLSHMYKADKDT